MESDIIQNNDDFASRVTLSNSIKKCFEGGGIAGGGNLSDKLPVFQIYRSQESFSFFLSEVHGNNRLFADFGPHSGSGWRR